jgi:hypothetical protein
VTAPANAHGHAHGERGSHRLDHLFGGPRACDRLRMLAPLEAREVALSLIRDEHGSGAKRRGQRRGRRRLVRGSFAATFAGTDEHHEYEGAAERFGTCGISAQANVHPRTLIGARVR